MAAWSSNEHLLNVFEPRNCWNYSRWKCFSQMVSLTSICIQVQALIWSGAPCRVQGTWPQRPDTTAAWRISSNEVPVPASTQNTPLFTWILDHRTSPFYSAKALGIRYHNNTQVKTDYLNRSRCIKVSTQYYTDRWMD